MSPRTPPDTQRGHRDEATAPVVRARGLTRVYQAGDVAVQALRGIDLDIAHGEFVAVMGASGCGKSTLMNLLGCLDRPTSGTYELAGRDVAHLSPDQLAETRNRTLGFVFQSFQLLPRTTALENVELPLLYGPLPFEEQRRLAREALTRVGLAGREASTPAQLSGGQQQRVAIARAVVSGPQMILADEPTGNLDTATSLEILALLAELHERGATLVMVTHEPEVAEWASRVITMRDGRIVEDRLQTPRRIPDRAAPDPSRP